MSRGVISGDADSYALLSFNDRRGPIGLAWLRTTCSIERGRRTSITEYDNNDVSTAEVPKFKWLLNAWHI